MSHATIQDLVDRFGERELIELTDRDGSDAINETVAQQALDDAAATVDGYIGQRYPPPYDPVPPVLVRATCDLARAYLYSDQAPEEVQRRDKAQREWLRAVGEGKISLGLPKADEPDARGAPAHRKGAGQFDDIKGF